MTNNIINLPHNTCDAIKVVAMLLVVTAHIGSVALGSAYEAKHWSFYVLATQSGYTGVAIFFFLSGYGLMESERKKHLALPQFVRKRFGKIYLPAILVTAIWLLVTPPHLRSCNSLIYELLWGFADPVMWFIRILFPLYLAFYVTAIIIRQTNENLALGMLLIASLAFAVVSILSSSSVRDHSVPLFALGAITSSIKTDKNALRKFSCIILSTGLLTSISVLFTSHPLTGFVHSFFDYLVVWLLVLFICSTKKPAWNLPGLITALTFDVYLVHFKFFTVASQYLPLTVFLILAIPGSLVCAYLFHKLRKSILKPILSR